MNTTITMSNEEFQSLWWIAIHKSKCYNPCRLCSQKNICRDNNYDKECEDKETYTNFMEEAYEKDSRINPSIANVENVYKRLVQESALAKPLENMLIEHYEKYKELVDIILDYNDSLERLEQLGLDIEKTVLAHTDKLPPIRT